MAQRAVKPPSRAARKGELQGNDQHAGPADLPRTPGETIVLVTAVLLLAALGYAVAPILSPFVVLGALIFLLYPWRTLRVQRRLLWLGVLLFTVWFLHSISAILAPFLIAFFFAYVMNPFVSRLERKGMARWLSSLLSILLLLGIGVGAVLFVLPPAIRQFEGIIGGLRLIVGKFVDLVNSGVIFEVLERYGIPAEKAKELLTTELSPKLEGLLKTLFEAAFGFLTGISSLLLNLINVVLVPFLIFYLLKDFPVIVNRFALLVPKERRDGFIGVARTTDAVLGSYFRGAFLVALLQGIIAGVVLWLMGVDYALVLGIMTGVLDFVPYLGLVISLIVSSIVASFSGDPVGLKVLGVVILYLSQKLLEATVFGPKIIGSHVGLHPVLLILCLLVFGYFMGFVGLLIAVPSTALILAFVREWNSSRKLTRMSPP
jgi:predicted PurR-regulated permease PerM